MSIRHLQRIGLIMIAQAIFVAGIVLADSSSFRYGWLPSIFAASALLIPFGGYIIALSDSSFFGFRSRALRYSLLTLGSIAVTFGGYALFLSLSFQFLWKDYEHDFDAA